MRRNKARLISVRLRMFDLSMGDLVELDGESEVNLLAAQWIVNKEGTDRMKSVPPKRHSECRSEARCFTLQLTFRDHES